MKFTSAFGAATTQGDWPEQEDAFYADARRGIFVLADGFGGNSLGARAAKAAIEKAASGLVDSRKDVEATKHVAVKPYYSDAENILLNLINNINLDLFQANTSESANRFAGVSLSIAFATNAGCWVLGSIGTNVMYVIRESQLRTLVLPHSLSHLRGDLPGVRTPYYDCAIQALGLQKQIEPRIQSFCPRQGDVLVMASAGAINGQAEIQARILAEVLQADRKPGDSLEESACQLLEQAADQAAFLSNASLLLVEPAI